MHNSLPRNKQEYIKWCLETNNDVIDIIEDFTLSLRDIITWIYVNIDWLQDVANIKVKLRPSKRLMVFVNDIKCFDMAPGSPYYENYMALLNTL